MLHSLRALVIAFDAIPAQERDSEMISKTATEIIHNRAWLIKIAQQLVLVDDTAAGGKPMAKAQRQRLARERAQREAAVKVELEEQRRARAAEQADLDAAADLAVGAVLSAKRGAQGGRARWT